MELVTYQESAFLKLRAQRILRLQRDAKERGEEFHETAPFAPLTCGARARFIFVECPGGYQPRAYIKLGGMVTAPEEALRAAEDIFGEPALLLKTDTSTSVLEFGRKKDPPVAA